MKIILYRLALIISIVLWCASVYLLLVRNPFSGEISIPDFGVHAAMFFGLAFMTTCAQRHPKVLLTLGALYVFGGLAEIAQHFNPPRTCDLIDYFEDVTGSTLGVAVALLWMSLLRLLLRWISRRQQKQVKRFHEI